VELSELLEGVPTVFSRGDKNSDITGITLDSRKIGPGELFFALPGAKTDGNRFVRDAVEHGAAAVISGLKPPPAPISLARPDAPESSVTWLQVDDVLAAMSRVASNFYGDPSSTMTVVGVTGTTGKTTTAYFLESIFARAGGRPGVIGTIEHRLGGRKLEQAHNTTPFSADLQRILARIKKEGGTHVAMEVSSHALSTQRVEHVHFDAAIWTNLQRDHLDFHKTRDAYFDAKAHLFELLEAADPTKSQRIGIINNDDEAGRRLKKHSWGVKIATYGLGEEADYAALGPIYTLEGTQFRLRIGERLIPLRIHLPGPHNLSNAAAAAACALELGITAEDVAAGLSAVASVPGRLEAIDAGQDFKMFIDYAHTDGGLISVLASLRNLPHRKIITVFGCAGDRDRGKRGPMGVAACRGSDFAIATSDNPRSEDPLAILKEIEAGLRQEGLENYRIIPDRKQAIEDAVRRAQSGDVVLIAGKGHEDYQILKDRTIGFDDRETARNALQEFGRI
jgi:UDP-N-acetylmuramoyl-L-alanyl-D-glutamate--2,6-diaminopimelate ligase